MMVEQCRVGGLNDEVDVHSAQFVGIGRLGG